MRMRVFLDDERFPPFGSGQWDIVRDVKSFIAMCEQYGAPDFISFDHDLGGEETGMQCAQWLIERDLDQPGFLPANFTYDVHSQNPVGAANIRGLLEPYLRQKAGLP